MNRKNFVLALIVGVLLSFAGNTAWSAPNPCPGPYDPALVSTNPTAYEPYDDNLNGQVCVATNKNAKPQIKDDQPPKK